jgi:hypothetical protein
MSVVIAQHDIPRIIDLYQHMKFDEQCHHSIVNAGDLGDGKVTIAMHDELPELQLPEGVVDLHGWADARVSNKCWGMSTEQLFRALDWELWLAEEEGQVVS